MTTKLYEIISATQLMHEPWHFVIKLLTSTLMSQSVDRSTHSLMKITKA